MKSYTGNISKEAFVAELKKHQAEDNFIRHTYEEYGKGCAVGCSIMSINKIAGLQLNTSSHRELENHNICPEWLARVEDTLFEGMSLGRSKTWPVEFAEAINYGADLNKIKIPFIVYILENNIKIQQNLLKNKDLPKNIIEVIESSILVNVQMIKAQKLGSAGSAGSAARSAAGSAAESAESAAWSARSAAMSAAKSAAGSAAESAAESAARSAAGSAAWSAWSAAMSAAESAAGSAARSAESAAWSAAESAVMSAAESAAGSARSAAMSAAGSAAESAARSAAGSAARSAARSAESAAGSAARSAAGSAAESASFEKYADKLLELIKECK